MTMGIYLIYWEQDESKVYIGQSINIQHRQKWHIDNLVRGSHYNYKLNNAYKLYGIPKQYILEECSEDKLDSLEVQWMNEFDAINSGYNITTGGVAGRGLNHSQSKYSKSRLLRIFSLLYSTVLSYKKISDLTKVNVYTVHNIASGIHHLWLKTEYPLQFEQMLKNKSIRNKTNVRSLEQRGIRHLPLVSPQGEIFENIQSIAEFCRTHPLLIGECDSISSSIAKVLKGTKKSHKGWHLQSE